jgi:hypothetical protein
MTVGECKAMLAIAGRYYDKAIPVGLAEDWAAVLDDIPEELGVAAMRAHVKRSRYFPTIADIREGAAAARPARLYLPPVVPDAVPQDEIREVVGDTLAKLRGHR